MIIAEKRAMERHVENSTNEKLDREISKAKTITTASDYSVPNSVRSDTSLRTRKSAFIYIFNSNFAVSTDPSRRIPSNII